MGMIVEKGAINVPRLNVSASTIILEFLLSGYEHLIAWDAEFQQEDRC